MGQSHSMPVHVLEGGREGGREGEREGGKGRECLGGGKEGGRREQGGREEGREGGREGGKEERHPRKMCQSIWPRCPSEEREEGREGGRKGGKVHVPVDNVPVGVTKVTVFFEFPFHEDTELCFHQVGGTDEELAFGCRGEGRREGGQCIGTRNITWLVTPPLLLPPPPPSLPPSLPPARLPAPVVSPCVGLTNPNNWTRTLQVAPLIKIVSSTIPAVRKRIRARVSRGIASCWDTAMDRVKLTAPRSPPHERSRPCRQSIPYGPRAREGKKRKTPINLGVFMGENK